MNKIKLLYGMGTLLSMVMPIIALASCNHETNVEDKNVDALEQVVSKSIKGLPDKLTIDNKIIDIKEDGILLSYEDYNGTIYDSKTGKIKKDYTFTSEYGGSNFSEDVIEFKQHSTFYVVYDEDQKDGIIPEKFKEQFGIMDTSYMSSSKLDDANLELGNSILNSSWGGKEIIVHFTNNSLNPWFGAQSNHLGKVFKSINETLNVLKSKVSLDVYLNILKFYGFKEKDGNLIDDPNIRNHASRVFYPLTSQKDMLTYTRVARNAYKVDININNAYNLSCVDPVFIVNNKVKSYGLFAFGPTTINQYETNNEVYTYAGRINKAVVK